MPMMCFLKNRSHLFWSFLAASLFGGMLIAESTIAIAEKSSHSLIIWASETSDACRFIVPLSFTVEIRKFSEGKSIPPSSASWSGDCVNGRISGYGTLQAVQNHKELFSFVGIMLNGSPDGAGIFHTLDGFAASVTLHDGTLFGPIVLSDGNGFRYEGGWTDRGPEGHGVMVQANSSRYEGDWQNGQREGRGSITWSSGNRYEGDWHQNLRTGHGILVLASGDRYEGEFKDGKYNGRGTFFYSSGVELEAEWVEGSAIGPASIRSPSGVRYDGGFRNGGPEGQGVLVEANGDRYEGDWHEDRPDGRGTLVRRTDGTTFTGHWTRGCFTDGERRAAFRVAEASCP